MSELGMKYIGQGVSLRGVPTHDLTASEAEHWGREYLLSTRLYVNDEAGAGEVEPLAYEYVGGGAFAPGIPARHLTLSEAERYSEGNPKLIEGSGLYQKIETGQSENEDIPPAKKGRGKLAKEQVED